MRTEKRIPKWSRIRQMNERLRETLDIPTEGVLPISVVELKGDREAVISGCCGVLEYGTETIILRVREGCVRITGTHLEMQSLITDRITVHGVIDAVYLEKIPNGKNGGRPL